jgi:hypothetical protein
MNDGYVLYFRDSWWQYSSVFVMERYVYKMVITLPILEGLFQFFEISSPVGLKASRLEPGT